MVLMGKGNIHYQPGYAHTNPQSSTAWGCQGRWRQAHSSWTKLHLQPTKNNQRENIQGKKHNWFLLFCPVHPHEIKPNFPKTFTSELKSIRCFSPNTSIFFFRAECPCKELLMLKFQTMFRLFSDENQTGCQIICERHFQEHYHEYHIHYFHQKPTPACALKAN